MLFYNQRIFARTTQKKSSMAEKESVKIPVRCFFENIYLIKEQRLGGVRIDLSFIGGKSMMAILMKFGCLCEKVLMKLSKACLQFVTLVFLDRNFSIYTEVMRAGTKTHLKSMNIQL